MSDALEDFLASHEVEALWADAARRWRAWRVEAKLKPYRTTSWKMQHKRWPNALAFSEAVDHSIAEGYQGIYAPSKAPGAPQRPSAGPGRVLTEEAYHAEVRATPRLEDPPSLMALYREELARRKAERPTIDEDDCPF